MLQQALYYGLFQPMMLFSSPAIENGVVYIGSEDGKVYALNASTGALIWSFTTDDEVTSSPAVVKWSGFRRFT